VDKWNRVVGPNRKVVQASPAPEASTVNRSATPRPLKPAFRFRFPVSQENLVISLSVPADLSNSQPRTDNRIPASNFLNTRFLANIICRWLWVPALLIGCPTFIVLMLDD
jgi:hypothetical protein